MRSDFPLPDTAWPPTAEFWAGAARHELRLPRCNGCDRLRWYPEAKCRHCHAEGLTWETLSGRGTLYSWVVVTHAFLAPFRDKVPFVPALVALEEDPSVRLATEIVDTDPDSLAFEMAVQAIFRPLSFTGVEGTVAAPLFKPRSSGPRLGGNFSPRLAADVSRRLAADVSPRTAAVWLP